MSIIEYFEEEEEEYYRKNKIILYSTSLFPLGLTTFANIPKVKEKQMPESRREKRKKQRLILKSKHK